MCSLRSSVALIVIGIAFLNNKRVVLNSSLDKLILGIVLIECRLCRANYPYKITVKVVLINNVILAHKLVECIISVNSFFTVYGFQDAVAYVVISIGITSNLFALSDGLTCKAVQGIIAILHSAVKLGNALALPCSTESIDILYYNVAVYVNSFLSN